MAPNETNRYKKPMIFRLYPKFTPLSDSFEPFSHKMLALNLRLWPLYSAPVMNHTNQRIVGQPPLSNVITHVMLKSVHCAI